MLVERNSLKDLNNPKALFFFTEKHFGDILDKIEREIVLSYCSEIPFVPVRLCTFIDGNLYATTHCSSLRDDVPYFGCLLIMRYLKEKGYGISLDVNRDNICLYINVADNIGEDADTLYAKYITERASLLQRCTKKEKKTIWDRIIGILTV